MNNKKAFTVVELIIAFIFVMTISLSMLKLVLTYQKLSKEAVLKQELSSFHEELISTIQKDVRIKLLKRIDKCSLKTDEKYCLELKFQDTSSAKLKVVKYTNKNNEEFDIFEYDDIKYIPTEGYFTSINPKKEEYFKEDTQKEINNCVQPFYGFPYNVGNIHKPKEKDFLHREERIELWDKKKDKFKGYKAKVKSKKLTDKEKEEYRSYLEFQSWNKFERELRLVRNQDIVTWLLCTELIDKLKVEGLNVEELQKLRLKDIDTDTAKQEKNNILNRIMPMQLPVTVYEIDDSHKIVKDKPLHTVYIEETETKLLKQGNFKALVKDRRLNGLFSFVDTSSKAESESSTISKSRVEYELGEYQNARIETIKDMLLLEETLIKKYKTLPTNKFKKMLKGWLEGKDEADKARFQNDVDLLVAVRNAFSHNQYPMRNRIAFANINPFSLSSANTSEEKKLDIANQLKDKTHKTIEKIIKIEKPIETKE